METEQNPTITEESKKQDKQDHFSDQEDANDSFQVEVDFIKNRTTTSNFKFNIQITKEQNKSESNSRRNTRLSRKEFLEKNPEDQIKTTENNKEKEQSTNPTQINREITKNDNSTTIFENNSSIVKKIEGSGSENDIVDGQNSDNEIKMKPPMTPNSSIYSYYQQLRDKYEKTGQLFEDEDFPCDQSIFCSERENPDGEFEIEFERPSIEKDDILFFTVEPYPNGNYNIYMNLK